MRFAHGLHSSHHPKVMRLIGLVGNVVYRIDCEWLSVHICVALRWIGDLFEVYHAARPKSTELSGGWWIERFLHIGSICWCSIAISFKVLIPSSYLNTLAHSPVDKSQHKSLSDVIIYIALFPGYAHAIFV